MNDMQKLAFEIGRQIELEKLAVLAKARKAVKTYWGHLSGKTLKDAKRYRDSLEPDKFGPDGFKIKKFKIDKFEPEKFEIDKFTPDGFTAKEWEKVEAASKVKDAAKSQYKTRRNTAIGAGVLALTGGGAYAYNKNKGNKK